MKDCLYIVMPAYNEEAAIKQVVEGWYSQLQYGNEDSRLVVADSGSTDSTHQILTDLQNQYPKLVILSDTLKQHGPKLIALYQYAIDQGATYVFQTDSDGQTVPREFHRFWELRKEYDVVMAHRPVREDGVARKIIEKVVCLLLKCYFGVSVPDANAPFRLMKAEVLNRYMDRFRPDYNLPNIMLVTFFAYYKERMIFRRITFKPRSGGENSINIPKIIQIGWDALKDFRRFKSEM